jgi:hypothetical protein
MKNSSWKLCLFTGVSCLMLFGNATKVCSAQENAPGPDERLQRIERRINELADRQDQMMRRLGAPQQPQQSQPQMAPQGGGPLGPQGPMPSLGPQNSGLPMPPMGWRGPVAERFHRDLGGLLKLAAMACILCNILMATWIFTDIRKRGEGSGIFIALALVAGIPAAIIYSLVRIGDKSSVTGK